MVKRMRDRRVTLFKVNCHIINDPSLLTSLLCIYNPFHLKIFSVDSLKKASNSIQRNKNKTFYFTEKTHIAIKDTLFTAFVF